MTLLDQKLPLHLKYRPQQFSDVIGQRDAIKSAERALKADQHSYLLLGPSGCGKTTTARIIASAVGCSTAGIIEVDAAQYSTVESTRNLVEKSEYRAIAATPQKAIILDEVHRLSAAAFAALLKPIEEPPKHCFWLLCTTEIGKIPVTIKSRCHTIEFRPIQLPTLLKYLEMIAEVEELKVDTGMLELCAKEANGSVRQALVFLAAVSGCKDLVEAKRVISSVDESGDLGVLMRQLVNGQLRWKDAVFHLGKLQDEDPEGVRLAILNYAQKVALSTTTIDKAGRSLAIMDAFMRPCNRSEKMAPILLAIGTLLAEKES